MKHNYPELIQKILEMSEGDEEFQMELTTALYNGLLELQVKYHEGMNAKNEITIQQIRHKIKPTLSMFEFNDLIEEIQKGKEIFESKGFGKEFNLHTENLNKLLEVALKSVFKLTQIKKKA